MKKIIAHRGLSGHYPENTLLSFERALKTKAPYIECDVHLTRDQIPVVIHDEYLDRTTNGNGKVRDYSLSALKKFSAGYHEKIPTLVEVLNLVLKKSSKSLFVEIKYHRGDPAYNKRVGKIVYKTVMEKFKRYKDRVVLISFSLLILRRLRTLDSTVQLAPLFYKHPKRGSLADQALNLGADMVIFSKKMLTHEGILKKTDRVKHFIYTVTPQEFKFYNKCRGLYGFATNFADLL